jgi:hypothetical protein
MVHCYNLHMTLEQVRRIQRELVPVSQGIPNGEPYLEFGIWALPFVHRNSVINVFLADSAIASESELTRLKREAREQFRRSMGS